MASIPATFSRQSWQKKSLEKANVIKLTENISTLRTSEWKRWSFLAFVSSPLPHSPHVFSFVHAVGHKNKSHGCHPLDGVTRAGLPLPSDATVVCLSFSRVVCLRLKAILLSCCRFNAALTCRISLAVVIVMSVLLAVSSSDLFVRCTLFSTYIEQTNR